MKLTRWREKQSATVKIDRPDADHLRIAGEGFEATMKPIPQSSFMLLRGFHWVQPMPVNR